MGMYPMLAALDERRRGELTADTDAVIAAASKAVWAREPWVLEIGKDEMFLAAALGEHAEGPAAHATNGRAIGVAVGSDAEYTCGRYLEPGLVAEVAARLAQLGTGLFPEADPDGYASDPRLESDVRLARVAKACELYGADPDDRQRMDGLAALLAEVCAFYVAATARGDGMLLFVR